MEEKIEYRVRVVTRYVVTKFHSSGVAAGSSIVGEFDNLLSAEEVGNSLMLSTPGSSFESAPGGKSARNVAAGARY